jgi:hypothetical protein
MNRRAALTAFMALIRPIAPFRTASCRVKFPDEIGEQPAVYFIYDGGDYPPRAAAGLPAKVTISGDLWIYDRVDDPDEEFGFTMAEHVDAIDKALGPDAFGRPQTLGGLVYDTRIEGNVILDPGHTSGQGVVKIPIKILFP